MEQMKPDSETNPQDSQHEPFDFSRYSESEIDAIAERLDMRRQIDFDLSQSRMRHYARFMICLDKQVESDSTLAAIRDYLSALWCEAVDKERLPSAEALRTWLAAVSPKQLEFVLMYAGKSAAYGFNVERELTDEDIPF